MTSCYLCGEKGYTVRPGVVRDKPELEIRECCDCGLVFLASFDHITEGFYENSGMHAGAVERESWQRETAWDDDRRFRWLRRVIENKSVLDVGCGNGGFLLRAREVATRVGGVEPENSLKEWFQQENLPVFSSLDEVSGNFDVITLFHVLEHIPDPRDFLARLADRLTEGGQIVVEVPSADDALLTLYQSESFSHFTYWSCHLFLFNQKTLSQVGKQAGLTVNYIMQTQRYSLANHLYWLAKGKPGGHQKWSFIDSPELHHHYEKQLAAIGACDTILASFSRGGR